MEGPRGVRPADLGSLRALTDLVMREGLVDQFAQLFCEDNYENLRVCVDDNRCVTHVGMTEGEAVLYGCRIQTACIGGVCTHPDYRKKGLASACFDDALRKSREDGVDIMIVSGDRNLYRMRGCVRVGSDLMFTISRDSAPISTETTAEDDSPRNNISSAAAPQRPIPDTQPQPSAPSVTADVMTEAELPLVMDCYRSEPVRFARLPDDYRHALQSGWVMNRPSDFLVVRERGEFRGYVIVPRAPKDGSANLAEFAGDRRAILAALPQLLERYGCTSLGFQVQRHDALMRSFCEQAGLQGAPRATPGTVTLVNFPQFMERMRPYFAERLGTRVASRLRFRQENEWYIFDLGDELLGTDRADASRLLFGTPEGLPRAAQDLHGALADALRTILPLPTLWYGINYV